LPPPISISDIINLFERQDVDKYHEMGGLEAFAREFETDLTTGLSQAEEDEHYETRRAKYGVNVLPDPPKESWCSMFIGCFQDLMLIILLVSAVVSLILTSVFPEGGGKPKISDYIDTISIFVAVLIVSCVQATVDYSQQKQFLQISKLKNEFEITVIRQGAEQQIPNTQLLVGDVLYLKSGDRVAADGFYINGHALKVNNSQETGESCAIEINDKSPFVLGGGAVESGDAHVLVCATGPNSQSGVTMMQIQEIEQEQEKSPLEKKLDKVAVLLTWLGAGGAILTFLVLLIFWSVDVAKDGYKKTDLNKLVGHFMVAVTIFICAVPEGLPLAVTLSLGFSMKKMMKDNNFVRHLNACETMGGATTICSDKTGTLTQNKMTVVKFFMDGQTYDGEPQLNQDVKNLFCEAVAINSSAYQTIAEGEIQPKYVGSSSECALLQMIEKLGADYKAIRFEHPVEILNEFNSARKKMSTVVTTNGVHRSYVKGAPDFVLEGCTRYMKADGSVAELTEDVRQSIFTGISQFADQSLRTMMVAYNDLGEGELQEEWNDPKVVESNLIVVGFVGIQDPLRPEVVRAIADCHTAQVVVRMVTGDYINTAKAIARECGILTDDGIAIEGREFSTKTKLELLDIAPKLQVMARSSPRDKYRLVSLLMEMGEVVAVTGDGSNDSPALKKANVGLSMGKCGTELAKMASDIVILDDNFNSIVKALRWGRCVYDNVRGFLQFQLTVNFSAMIVAFIGSCVLKNSPLKTIQLLWVNLIMDSLGALALATFGPTDALLHRPPYGESDGLISPVLARNIIGHCTYQIIVLLLFLFGTWKIFKFKDTGPGISDEVKEKKTSTLVFNVFVYMQVFNLVNGHVASQDMKVTDGLFTNPFFLMIFLIVGGLQALLLECAGSAFETVHLNAKEWGICLAFGAGELIIGILLRLITLPDKTTEKLNALRARRRQEMEQRYSGMSFDEQWAIDYSPPKDDSDDEKKEEKEEEKDSNLLSDEKK